jgi:hypothetical protein
VADLYLDEDVPVVAVGALRRLGHRAYHARSLCRGGKADVQLLLAARLGCVLVTGNRADFVALHHAWHHWAAEWGVRPAPEHAGILLTRPGWPAPRLAAAVHDFFGTGRPAANRLYRWAGEHVWVEVAPTYRSTP